MGMWLVALGGTIIKLDHSFKLVRRIRGSDGERQFGAVLTVMNEFCQVMLVVFCWSWGVVFHCIGRGPHTAEAHGWRVTGALLSCLHPGAGMLPH